MPAECSLLRTLWLESELFRDHVKRMGLTFAQASRTALHVHHIFGGKTRKDLPSNTITICGAVHDFCHTHEWTGRIACLKWKLDAGQLDWTEIDQSAGYSVEGRLWGLQDHMPEPFKKMAHVLARDAERARHATAHSTDTSPPMPHT